MTSALAYQTGVAKGTYSSVSSTYTGSNLRTQGSLLVAFRTAAPTVSRPLVQTFMTQVGGSTAAYPSNNGAGHLLVAALINATSSPTNISSDSAGNTWTSVCNVNTSFWSMHVYYAANSKAGANTLTLSGTTQAVWLAEYANIVPVSPLDVQTTCTTNTEATGNMTTTAKDILLTVYSWEYMATGQQTGGAGWYLPVYYKYLLGTGQLDSIQVYEQDYVAAGTYSNTITNGTTNLRGRGIVQLGFKVQPRVPVSGSAVIQ